MVPALAQVEPDGWEGEVDGGAEEQQLVHSLSPRFSHHPSPRVQAFG